MKRIMSDQLALVFSIEGKQKKISLRDYGILFHLVNALKCHFEGNAKKTQEELGAWLSKAKERLSKK